MRQKVATNLPRFIQRDIHTPRPTHHSFPAYQSLVLVHGGGEEKVKEFVQGHAPVSTVVHVIEE